MKRIIIFLFIAINIVVAKAQNYSDYFTTYTPAYTPSRPVYVTPMPSFYDNSVTIIDNSYRSHTSKPRVTCTNSQKESGKFVMIDTTTNKDSVVDGEVLFKSYSDNTISITITKLKIDNKWYPMNIDVCRLSDLLDGTGIDRNTILDLMKNFYFFAMSEEVIFLF